MTVNMVTLPEPQSGAKRPKLTTPKNDTSATVLYIYQTIKALPFLRLLYGSEMVVLGVSLVSVKCLALIFHKKMTMQYS